MAQVLDKILAYKRDEVAAAKAAVPEAEMRARAEDAPPVRPFFKALRSRIAEGVLALIAEIKKASPSKGLIRADFDPAALARAYENGWCCVPIGADRHAVLPGTAGLSDGGAEGLHASMLAQGFHDRPLSSFRSPGRSGPTASSSSWRPLTMP